MHAWKSPTFTQLTIFQGEIVRFWKVTALVSEKLGRGLGFRVIGLAFDVRGCHLKRALFWWKCQNVETTKNKGRIRVEKLKRKWIHWHHKPATPRRVDLQQSLQGPLSRLSVKSATLFGGKNMTGLRACLLSNKSLQLYPVFTERWMKNLHCCKS